MTLTEAFYEAFEEGNVELICKALFGVDITLGQADIIRSIVLDSDDKICITAHTRYGKTWAVSKAVLLWVFLHENHEVDIIGPQYSQAQKLREYIAEDIINSPSLTSLVDTQAGSQTERMKKEVSRKHITFKNGSNIRILSGEGSGERLMGMGGQLIVCDESCLLNYDTYRSKISRMKEGDEYKEVHISNPWNKDNQFYRFWEDPEWTNIHIGWEQGVREGRILRERVQEQRGILTDIEFQILYDSEFPDTAEDALIPYSHIFEAIEYPLNVEGDTVWGLDVAEKGTDLTVLTEAVTDDGESYDIKSIRVIDRDETMPIVSAVRGHVNKSERINVDSIGVGAGVHSRLKELGYDARSIRVGRAPTKGSDRFMNQKAQHYWRLKELFEQGRITIPDRQDLKTQLSSIRWELTSGGKIKIIDPESGSPDFADSLMLCCAEVRESNAWSLAVKPRSTRLGR